MAKNKVAPDLEGVLIQAEKKVHTDTVCFKKYSLSSAQGRRWHTIWIAATSAVSCITLIVFIITDILVITTDLKTISEMQSQMETSIQTADFIHSLQIERGTTVLYLCSLDTPKDAAKIYERLNGTIYEKTTDGLNSIQNWPANEGYMGSKETVKQHIKTYRDKIAAKNTTATKEETINFYSPVITDLIGLLSNSELSFGNSILLRQFIGYKMFITSKEITGIERALGGSYFATGYFQVKDLLWYAKHNTLSKEYMSSSCSYAPNLKRIFDEEVKTNNNTIISILEQKREIILMNNHSVPSVKLGEEWFNLMTVYIDVLLKTQNRFGSFIKTSLAEHKDNDNGVLTRTIILLITILIAFPILILSVIKMTSKIYSFALKLKERTVELEKERKRSENLLHEMLPVTVANKLMNNELVPAEEFQAVTVYFSDVVGFTEICAEISPMQVTAMLNSVYGEFDKYIDMYDVYKVETIGDAYMVVSGLPLRNGNKHADEIAKMSLRLRESIQKLEVPFLLNKKLSIRIGVHTGSCVAGVVGTKMPRYCLFGDTVNTASRMESMGQANMIHISSSTKKFCWKLEDMTFNIEDELKLRVKGRWTRIG